MKPYPLFRKENIPAYLAIMALWAVLSTASAAVLVWISPALSAGMALVWAGASVMAGMLIMFTASVINMRKLGPGFQRLASGEPDPEIPPVWCPVLTAAVNAALTLKERLGTPAQSPNSATAIQGPHDPMDKEVDHVRQ